MACGRNMGHGDSCVKGYECNSCIERNTQKEFIDKVANLFDEDITDMSQLDAADFKDKAGDIWSLVEEARKFKD